MKKVFDATVSCEVRVTAGGALSLWRRADFLAFAGRGNSYGFAMFFLKKPHAKRLILLQSACLMAETWPRQVRTLTGGVFLEESSRQTRFFDGRAATCWMSSCRVRLRRLDDWSSKARAVVAKTLNGLARTRPQPRSSREAVCRTTLEQKRPEDAATLHIASCSFAKVLLNKAVIFWGPGEGRKAFGV